MSEIELITLDNLRKQYVVSKEQIEKIKTAIDAGHADVGKKVGNGRNDYAAYLSVVLNGFVGEIKPKKLREQKPKATAHKAATVDPFVVSTDNALVKAFMEKAKKVARYEEVKSKLEARRKEVADLEAEFAEIEAIIERIGVEAS